MTKEMVDAKTGEITSWNQEQIDLLKRTVGKSLSNDEFMIFLNVAKKVQLDPFSKQIYAIKYGPNMTIQTSIDGFRLIADRTDNYAPGRASTFTYKGDQLESATAYIQKYVKGQWFEVAATAFYGEYVNNVNSLWKKLPHAMLSKCAESLALRRAFPNETSGLYTTEEMSQAEDSPNPIEMPKAKKSVSTMKDIPVDEDIVESEPIEEPIPWPESVPNTEFPYRKYISSLSEFDKGPVIPQKNSESSKFLGRLQQIAREKGLSPEKMKASMQILFSKDSSKLLTDEECSKLIKQIENGAIRSS